MTYTVRLGRPEDLPGVLGLINQAAEWLRKNKATDQWAKPWPNEQERNERVMRGLAEGRTWIVEESSEVGGEDYLPAATITCRWDANPKLWHELATSQPAVYVSRLIVNRDYKGLKLGQELIEWAGKWARKQYGAQWIRIDVWTTNSELHEFYKGIGFGYVGDCEEVDYPSAALFQRSTWGLERVRTPRLTEIPQLVRPFLSFDISAARTGSAARSREHVQRQETHTPGLNVPRDPPRCARGRDDRQPQRRLVRACASVTRHALFRRLRWRRGPISALTGRRRLLRLG